jgi:hypothetical protein
VPIVFPFAGQAQFQAYQMVTPLNIMLTTIQVAERMV